MSSYFQEALREWWHVAWSELLAYQKRFVENGYREDGTWAYQIATTLLPATYLGRWANPP